MGESDKPAGEGRLVDEVINAQLAHFRNSKPPCRGMQLPDGVLLRHTQSESLYFYLRTVIENATLLTTVYASDSPYDRQKAAIGTVRTPMFETASDYVHLQKVEEMIRSWVDFVRRDPDSDRDFESFHLKNPH